MLQALVNGQVRKRIDRGETVTQALDWAMRRLKEAGPAGLDVNDPADRTKAVSATLQASLDLLDPEEIDRYIELAIFPQNVQVPLPVLTRYWHAAGGWIATESMFSVICWPIPRCWPTTASIRRYPASTSTTLSGSG